MMELSRRSFFGGALALTAVATLPIKALASVPTIYGDGNRDDWAGLQAMFDGEPFRVDGEGFDAWQAQGNAVLRGGSFKISKTLHLGRSEKVYCALERCNFVSEASPTFYMHDNSLLAGAYTEPAPYLQEQARPTFGMVSVASGPVGPFL